MEYIGRNSIVRLKEIVHGKVLLFTQEGVYRLFRESIDAELKNADATVFDQISQNPKRDEIQNAQESFNGSNFDLIVAFGGGSVIDFAKAFRHYDRRTAPLVAIPTTAGTGSEATQFAVVYVDGVKTSLDDPKILPDFAIADSQFTECAPRYLKACSAMDAYCQAIESFWAVRATDESRRYALEAIGLCRDWIIEAVNTSDRTANEMMMRASHLAGKAINISRTTAAHALSYKITTGYGIPHGHAVALTIAQVFKANLGSIKDEGVLLHAIGIERNGIDGYFRTLMSAIGLETDFAKLGIENFAAIVDSVNLDRLENNPFRFSRDGLMNVFEQGLAGHE